MNCLTRRFASFFLIFIIPSASGMRWAINLYQRWATRRQTALLLDAIQHDKVDAARNALEQGANVNATCPKSYRSPLHSAVEQQSLQIGNLLLARGANPNSIDLLYRTPLHLAVKQRRSQTVKTLLAHGANVEACDYKRETPLHCAVARNAPKMVEALLANDANINARNLNRQTPLHIATLTPSPHVLPFLLGHADIDALDERGNRPIHIAPHSTFETYIRCLLIHNVSVYTHIRRILMAHGARIIEDNRADWTVG